MFANIVLILGKKKKPKQKPPTFQGVKLRQINVLLHNYVKEQTGVLGSTYNAQIYLLTISSLLGKD